MRIIFILSAILIFQSVNAKIVLPSVIGDNMVLQQKAKVKLWGWAGPSEKVYVTPSWNNKTDSAKTTAEGKWSVNIETPAGGGPYSIKLNASNTIILNNVLVGEVWICSGQSNMEYNFYSGLKDFEREIANAKELSLRFFNIPKTTSEYPQDDLRTSWSVSDSNTIKSFSAVGYYFGKRLSEVLGVPVGLINASWGGSPAETWVPLESFLKDDTLKSAATKLPYSDYWSIRPGVTFNGMIAPLTNYSISGAIWYQGETNTNNPLTYDRLLATLINSWRAAWSKDFPFYFVQIAPFTYGPNVVGALVREAQTKALKVPNTGMVVTTDLVDDIKDIHPKNKKDVGLRLANLALEDHYHLGLLSAKSPLYKSMQVNKDKVIISFDNLYTSLQVQGKSVTELFIAGPDKIFRPAKGKIKEGQLIVYNKEVKYPVAVRYSFGNESIGNLYSKEGLPVAPFRTDDW